MEATKQRSPLMVVAVGGATAVVLTTVMATIASMVATAVNPAWGMAFADSWLGMSLNAAIWLSGVLIVAGVVAGLVRLARGFRHQFRGGELSASSDHL